jgi:hypothetical protein
LEQSDCNSNLGLWGAMCSGLILPRPNPWRE